MALALAYRLALALLALAPTAWLYLSTLRADTSPLALLLRQAKHASDCGSGFLLLLSSSSFTAAFSQETDMELVLQAIHGACAVYTALWLLLWAWLAGHRSLARRFFTLSGSPWLASGHLQLLVLVLLPGALVALQVADHPQPYSDLMALLHAGWHHELVASTLLWVSFDVFAAFCICAQLWFGLAYQLQRRAFELGQDRQHYTTKIYFLHSGSSSPLDDAPRRKARELAADPTYHGFTTIVMPMNEFDPDLFLDEGSVGIVFVIDPFSFTSEMQEEITLWLSDEATLRAAEAASLGPLVNIVYSTEGNRRIAFLRVKFAVYALLPNNFSSLQAPSVDIPRYIDEWLSQFGACRVLPCSHGAVGRDFRAWKAQLNNSLASLVVNPNAKSPLVRQQHPESYMGHFEFLHWLDSCPDPACHNFHKLQIEKIRERPSRFTPRFVDLLWWWFSSAEARHQIERRYEVFGKANQRLLLSICAVIAVFLASFLPLKLHYYPTIDLVHFFCSFTGLLSLAYFLWGVMADYRRTEAAHSAHSSTPAAPNKTSDGPKAEMAPLAPSGDTVLAPKYHFHTNTEHYQQEVEEKAETSLTQPPKNPYCPLSDPAPLLRVPYTCPLLDATDGTKAKPVFGRDGDPLFDEDYEEFDKFLPPVFGGEKDNIKWHPSESSPPEDGAEEVEKPNKTDSPLDDENLIVNPTFTYRSSMLVPYFCVWSDEFFHKNMTGEPIVMVTMPGTNLTLPYQLKESTERSERQRELAITQDGALNENSHDEESKAEQAKVTELMRLFESFQPGLPPPREILDKDSILLQKLIQSEILVAKPYWSKRIAYFQRQNARARQELETVGYTILKNLFPKRHVYFLRRYYRRVFQAFGGQPVADKLAMQKFNWNDESVARYINLYLSSMIYDITQKPITSAGLALSLWIMKGQGFPLHRDSVPPFDLTLDYVVDHVGPESRPITFIRRRIGALTSHLPGVDEITLSLPVGAAILFRGSELAHFGGNLSEGNYHNVMLWTWYYVRD